MAFIRCGGSNYEPVEAAHMLQAGAGGATALPATAGPGLGLSFIIGTKGYTSVTLTPSHQCYMGITGIDENGNATPIFAGDSDTKVVDVTNYVEVLVLNASTTSFSTSISIA